MVGRSEGLHHGAEGAGVNWATVGDIGGIVVGVMASTFGGKGEDFGKFSVTRRGDEVHDVHRR